MACSTARFKPQILAQRLQARQISSSSASTSPSLSSPLPNSDPNPNPHHNSSSSSFSSSLKWLSGIALGSSLGLLYLSSNSSSSSSITTVDPNFFKKLLSSLLEGSTPRPEGAVQDRSRIASALSKLSLPDGTPKFLLGDAYRRKIFFNYERRIRLRSPPAKFN